MKRALRLNPTWLVFLTLACNSGPSDPSGSSLRVTVLGLPNGASAAITISGPSGYSQPASGTQTFSQLTPGTYTVTATAVTFNTSEYSPAPPSQTLAVGYGSGLSNATVTYTQSTGNLSVSITGLGTASTAAVTVTGAGYTQDVQRTTTLRGLDPGSYVITARDTVATGGAVHTASPTSQTVTISASATDSATVAYSPLPADGTVNLRIAGMYLTQSAQTYAGSVPLVRGRDGYLRVFAVADRTNVAAPAVKVRFLSGGTAVDSATIVAPRVGVPTVVDESDLRYSWNVPVAGSLIQPGLSIQAEVDPAGAVNVAETVESDNIYPTGTPPLLDIRTVPAVDLTFVPVVQPALPASRNRGNVSEANKGQILQMSQKMHPISSFNAVVHVDYTTDTPDTLESGNGNNAWGTILNELDMLRIAEGSTQYYYGVAQVSYQSGVAGVAYVSTSTIGGRAGLGWDKSSSASIVAAHELGHNWGRNHAPCGGPLQVDPQYPQSDGSIGSYGVDVATQTLRKADLGDIMGYCDPKWIGDYTYRGVLNYLLAPSQPIVDGGAGKAVQPCLVVWGHIRKGEMVLEPAFQVNTRPSLPARPGLYSLSGLGTDGSTLFALSFTPNQISDGGEEQQNFAFAVPLSGVRAARLASIHVAGGGRTAVRSSMPAGPGAAAGAAMVVRRTGPSRVALRWDNRVHPMVMVRDPDTGQILSLGRRGEVQLSTTKSRVDLVISDGIKSKVKRVRVTQ